MMLFRNAHLSDLDAIVHLARQSGIGMTSLPQNKSLLKQRLLWSCDSYVKEVLQPGYEYYLFVLEDMSLKKIVGTSAIEASTGYKAPCYSYKLSYRRQISYDLKLGSEYQVLTLVNDNQGCTELCTLFLDPVYRKDKNGLLLSKGRFLFIAHHPLRFTPKVIAEMRGISDPKGHSPFWKHLGFHFFHISFKEADRLTLATNKQFIADLMPQNPIYVNLLNSEAQAVIGQPHPSTIPAMKILLKEGFEYNQYVDIFDAGPSLEAKVDKIKTITTSRVLLITNLCDDRLDQPSYLLANMHPLASHFRATIQGVLLNHQNNTCVINKETADLLKVQCHDKLRVSKI